MKVNGIDIRKYNAKQLTVDLQPPSFSANTEWLEGAATPHEFETEVQYGTLKLTILFRGSGRSEIVRTVSEMLALMTQRTELALDGYKGRYIGDITSNSLAKTKQANRYILTLQFNGYLTDAEVVNTYTGVREARFTTLGTRKAPCIIIVHPTTNLQQLTISGFGEYDITIGDLKRDVEVIIDGEKGTVTEDGMNKFGDCDMWEFPVLVNGVENLITFSSNKCDIEIRYSPMWI
jgi:phage-related protein|nr:hypothetical protein [uncultured Acetatifactor sp.]